jgi:hypothetical protein
MEDGEAMMEYISVEIARDGVPYEISAKIEEHGKYETGLDMLGGRWYNITEDPMLTEFTCLDEHGVELQLTLKEVLIAEERMVEKYWSDSDYWLDIIGEC